MTGLALSVMEIAIVFIVGVIVGAGIALIIGAVRARAGRDTFAALAAEALDANSRRLAELAGTSRQSPPCARPVAYVAQRGWF